MFEGDCRPFESFAWCGIAERKTGEVFFVKLLALGLLGFHCKVNRVCLRVSSQGLWHNAGVKIGGRQIKAGSNTAKECNARHSEEGIWDEGVSWGPHPNGMRGPSQKTKELTEWGGPQRDFNRERESMGKDNVAGSGAVDGQSMGKCVWDFSVEGIGTG